ncbi:cytosolic cu zn superoxide dismutase [Niveomyces insectorum RCEF 264]|uniref:superoxide dismutase n=1 Tax=Niveomyces insectorum RCEF 264 TaxID=1081102 RepID=A0A167VHL6_9HYPO|nr:cytosolic cu zn superoxide dismutase [Niveomyces insectorum RCEF 264]
MRASTLLSAVVAAAAGVSADDTASSDGPLTGEEQKLGNATVTVNNPPGEAYVATLPSKAFDAAAYPDGGNAKGSIWAEARPDGIGVVFKVNFSNLPKTGGPFTYHIHANPVPADGNCTSTGGHLDPFGREDDPACNSKLKQTCQVGDLAGKHGKITSDPFNATYLDLFASTAPGNPAFFGNLSFVLHYPNKTRISCANFAPAKSADLPATGTNSSHPATGTGASSASGGAADAPSTTPQAYATVNAAAGGASRVAALGAAGVAAAAFALLL